MLKEEGPGLYLSISSDVAPVMGEYERSATALFNAYVGPVVSGYLARLERTLLDAGLKQKLLVVQANGGVTTTSQVVPIFTVESGPAAGVVGAAYLARSLGVRTSSRPTSAAPPSRLRSSVAASGATAGRPC